MDRKLAQRAAAAAQAGDLNAVRAAVAQDGAVARHWSVLMNSCFGGHRDVAAFLIAEGADVNVQSPNAHRYRPLHRVVEHKKTMPKTPDHTATVRLLLEHGADPMLRGSWNLHSAVAVAAFGCTEFLPLLLEHAPGAPDPYTAAVLARHADLAAILAETPAAATRPTPTPATGAGCRCSTAPAPWPAPSRTGWPRPRCCSTTAPTLRQRWTTRAGRTTPRVVELLLESRRSPRATTIPSTTWHATVRSAVLDSLLRHGAIDMHGTRGTGHHGGYNPLGCAVNMRSLRGVDLVPGPRLRPQQRAQQERRNRAPRRRQHRRRRPPRAPAGRARRQRAPARHGRPHRPRPRPRQTQDQTGTVSH